MRSALENGQIPTLGDSVAGIVCGHFDWHVSFLSMAIYVSLQIL